MSDEIVINYPSRWQRFMLWLAHKRGKCQWLCAYCYHEANKRTSK